MRNTLKTLLSFSLFLILVTGVTGYYFQIYSKSGIVSLSNFSDEEDVHEKDFIKDILFEDLRAESSAIGVPQNILFPHTTHCILEGHTGLVTPPPWS